MTKRPSQGWRLTSLLVGICVILTVAAYAQTAPDVAARKALAARVLVVYHEGLAESRDVAMHYATLRSIPTANLCGVNFPDELRLTGQVYLDQVKPALRKCLETATAKKVLYIVFSYRTPYKVAIPGQRFEASVDSLVADIWDEANRTPLPAQVSQPHGYFAGVQSQANIFPDFVSLDAFRRRTGAPRIYSVWRLDAASADLAKGLVEKAIRAEQSGGPQGIGCFDRNRSQIRNSSDGGYVAGEWDIQRAADLARMAGFDVELDTHKEEFGTAPAPDHCGPAALYAGWYSLNNYNDAFTWAEGAIGLHLDSMSAWNLREGKSWVTNAVSRGITVSGGAVSEPFLPNLTQADGMLHCLFQGANVGDAFLRNTRLLKFRIVNVGDPLYTPFVGGKGAFREGAVPAPAILVRSPRTLGGVPGVVRIRAGGDANKARDVKLSVHPRGLGQTPATLRFEAGVEEQEIQIPTVGVSEPKALRIHVDSGDAMAAATMQVLPALRSLRPQTMELSSGQDAKLVLAVGAHVLAQPAPVDMETDCPGELEVPDRVFIQAGNDRTEFRVRARTITSAKRCEVRAVKFGVPLIATIELKP